MKDEKVSTEWALRILLSPDVFNRCWVDQMWNTFFEGEELPTTMIKQHHNEYEEVIDYATAETSIKQKAFQIIVDRIDHKDENE